MSFRYQCRENGSWSNQARSAVQAGSQTALFTREKISDHRMCGWRQNRFTCGETQSEHEQCGEAAGKARCDCAKAPDDRTCDYQPFAVTSIGKTAGRYPQRCIDSRKRCADQQTDLYIAKLELGLNRANKQYEDISINERKGIKR